MKNSLEITEKTVIRTHLGKDIVEDSSQYTFSHQDIKRYDPLNYSIPTINDKAWQLTSNIIGKSQTGYLGDYINCYQGEVNISTHKDCITRDSGKSPFLKGSQIAQYTIQPPSQGELEWLDKDLYIKKVGNSPKARHHQQQRLVMQGISGVDDSRRLIATLCDAGTFLGHSTNYVVLDASTPTRLNYFLALLNSSLLEWRYRQTSTNNNINSYEVEALPAVIINFTTPAAEREQRVQQILKVYEHDNADGDAVLAGVQAALAEGKSDVVHDVLAHLAQVMIDLNQTKQAEVKRFLGWLESTLKIMPKDDASGFDVFSGKTIIHNYLGDYQKGEKELAFEGGKENLVYRLNQNKNKFHAKLADVKGQIQSEYENSLATLLPIKHQLSRTDALIDRIVYKLYGLTDAEIELIERPQYEQAISEARESVLADKSIEEGSDEALSAIGDKVFPSALRYAEVTNTSVAQASLDNAFPQWRTLPDDLPRLLLSAEKDYLDESRADYSGSVINYAKVVEISLNQKLFVPFKQAGFTANDVVNEQAFKKFMVGKVDGIMLGSVDFVLSSREKIFHRFLQQRYPDKWQGMVDKQQMRRYFDVLELQRRNDAAHNKIMTRDEAQAARVWAFAVLAYL